MKRSSVTLIKISLLAIITLIILGYGLFQARNLLIGPEILISSPTDGDSTTTPTVLVSGTVTNINHISLDDRPIFVDKVGNFSEKLLLQPGYNIIKLRAEDRFGRVKQKLVELTYILTSTSSAASSTQDIIQ